MGDVLHSNRLAMQWGHKMVETVTTVSRSKCYNTPVSITPLTDVKHMGCLVRPQTKIRPGSDSPSQVCGLVGREGGEWEGTQCWPLSGVVVSDSTSGLARVFWRNLIMPWVPFNPLPCYNANTHTHTHHTYHTHAPPTHYTHTYT